MVNRHFGKAGDVWKHVLLAAVVAGVRPRSYAETHAGSARNVMDDHAERRYGVRTYLDRVDEHPRLAACAYTRLARAYLGGDTASYPGSALIALELLDPATDVLLCDLDPESVAALRAEADRLHRDRCRVVERDGMAAVADWLGTAPGPALVHVDPFDPHAHADGGRSALELAADAADSGAAVAYWYGYDGPDERAWALTELADRTAAPLACLDMGVRDGDGRGRAGHLGTGTTPGTGFGHVLANVADDVVASCAALGEELVRLYDGVSLPDGTRGTWQLTVVPPGGVRGPQKRPTV